MDKYLKTATTVSFIQYHFVFCSRYRRKIFDISHVEDRFKELTRQTCQKQGIEILAMECHQDHVHLFLKCLPQQSPAGIMKKMKGASSRTLREEFPMLGHAPSLWTRNYLVSTEENLPSETIQKYVETQKKRS